LHSREDSTRGAQSASIRATKGVFRRDVDSFRHEPRRKRTNLKKDHLEVLAVTLKPFEELCPRIKTPWPELNSWICCLMFRCRTRDESCTNLARLATHCSRRGSLYHAHLGLRKGVFTLLVCGEAALCPRCKNCRRPATSLLKSVPWRHGTFDIESDDQGTKVIVKIPLADAA
jgi:hypothetical protein